MAKALHAVDYLAACEKHPPQAVCAVFGADPFLKRQVLLRIRQAVLGTGEGDISLTSFEGKTAKLADIQDELSTLAMFGDGKRMAVVEEADDFVTRFRAELEDYVAKPSATGVLVLELKTLAANTRLYKAIDAAGLLVDCNAPAAAGIAKWLRSWAKQAHGFQLDASAADGAGRTRGPGTGTSRPGTGQVGAYRRSGWVRYRGHGSADGRELAGENGLGDARCRSGWQAGRGDRPIGSADSGRRTPHRHSRPGLRFAAPPGGCHSTNHRRRIWRAAGFSSGLRSNAPESRASFCKKARRSFVDWAADAATGSTGGFWRPIWA